MIDWIKIVQFSHTYDFRILRLLFSKNCEVDLKYEWNQIFNQFSFTIKNTFNTHSPSFEIDLDIWKRLKIEFDYTYTAYFKSSRRAQKSGMKFLECILSYQGQGQAMGISADGLEILRYIDRFEETSFLWKFESSTYVMVSLGMGVYCQVGCNIARRSFALQSVYALLREIVSKKCPNLKTLAAVPFLSWLCLPLLKSSKPWV